jgi:hypothetical protein
MVPDNTDLTMMREVLLYLELHPNAADTLDGILMWWCKRQSNELDAEILKTILDELVNNKKLVKIVSQSGEAIYKRSP